MYRRIVPIQAEKEEDFAVVVTAAHVSSMAAALPREAYSEKLCPRCVCTVTAQSARKHERPGGL